tara:strand:- start:78 stop:344 length:267 start_codon:yes stop_codon:yes gene_type:complete
VLIDIFIIAKEFNEPHIFYISAGNHFFSSLTTHYFLRFFFNGIRNSKTIYREKIKFLSKVKSQRSVYSGETRNVHDFNRGSNGERIKK